MSGKVISIERATGKGRQPSAIEAVRDQADELHALHHERDAVSVEIEALSRRIQLAVWNDRPDVALQVAGRLDALAQSMRRKGAA